MIDYKKLIESDGENVIVTDVNGKTRKGYCHCYAELNDDEKIEVYISIGSIEFYPEDIESLEILP